MVLTTVLLFSVENVTQFYKAHNGRQGIGVLGFQTNSVDAIESQYRKHHSKLIKESVQIFETAKVLEVYAYYTGDSSDSDVDTGTVLRFVQPLDGDLVNSRSCLLPGIEPVAADFDETSQAAYCDHWVSNGELLHWKCICAVLYYVFVCLFSLLLVHA
jgi:hypothetical protein